MRYLFIDRKVRYNELEYFKSIGVEVITVPTNNKVYEEISSHTDIHIVKLFDKYVVSVELYEYLETMFFCNEKYLDLKDKLIVGESCINGDYPLDIPYNIFTFRNNVVHNFKYTDSKCLEVINSISNINKINVKQGYSNCSCVNVDDKICITSNMEIYEKLNNSLKSNLNYYEKVIYVDNSKCDIKLIKNDGNYSNMKGFIGGCMSYINNKLVIFGDKKYIDNIDIIKEKCKKSNIEIVYFKNLELIDYGKIIIIE